MKKYKDRSLPHDLVSSAQVFAIRHNGVSKKENGVEPIPSPIAIPFA
jgi:hypothetical protein